MDDTRRDPTADGRVGRCASLLGRLLRQVPPAEPVDADTGRQHGCDEVFAEHGGGKACDHGGDHEGCSNAVERSVHADEAIRVDPIAAIRLDAAAR